MARSPRACGHKENVGPGGHCRSDSGVSISPKRSASGSPRTKAPTRKSGTAGVLAVHAVCGGGAFVGFGYTSIASDGAKDSVCSDRASHAGTAGRIERPTISSTAPPPYE